MSPLCLGWHFETSLPTPPSCCSLDIHHRELFRVPPPSSLLGQLFITFFSDSSEFFTSLDELHSTKWEDNSRHWTLSVVLSLHPFPHLLILFVHPIWCSLSAGLAFITDSVLYPRFLSPSEVTFRSILTDSLVSQSAFLKYDHPTPPPPSIIRQTTTTVVSTWKNKRREAIQVPPTSSLEFPSIYYLGHAHWVPREGLW